MKFKHILLHLAWLVPVLVIATYAFNPLGIPTWDPRGRLLGAIPYRLPSVAMAPTYNPGDYVIACTTAYVLTEPAVGDVIVFVPPPTEQGLHVKRIIGIAGDTVRFEGAKFLRNGKLQHESYVAPGNDITDIVEYRVPPGSVFVAGDNRAHSFDSRHFGSIATGSIIGKVCGRL